GRGRALIHQSDTSTNQQGNTTDGTPASTGRGRGGGGGWRGTGRRAGRGRGRAGGVSRGQGSAPQTQWLAMHHGHRLGGPASNPSPRENPVLLAAERRLQEGQQREGDEWLEGREDVGVEEERKEAEADEDWVEDETKGKEGVDNGDGKESEADG
ncbi:hypothetical protein BC936DRAFT_146164, partial [Jimgerdemannia flammicorona]